MARPWIIPLTSPELSAVSERWRVPTLVAQLLLNRGLSPDEPADAFLAPQLKELHPPEALPGATKAAGIIIEAIGKGSKIVLYGDYDVDGTTGLAILWHTLTLASANVTFYVPHRIDEGYGIGVETAQRLAKDGADLIVTIDCGITATEVAHVLKEAGVTLIVTDHHTPKDDLPEAAAIVHPTAMGPSPNPDLCGAGVAFKLAWAIGQALSESTRVTPEVRKLLIDMLPLAALGTIADVVPLRGENRIIARHGLLGLESPALPGLRALIESAGLGKSRISGYDVGFKLAPRINAAGRMGHARLAVELFTRADENRAREIALYLEDHNRSRQATERQITRQAIETVDRLDLASDARRAIVLASEGWHAGVIGIVAARLVDRYHRPTVIISLNGNEGQGSARSIQPFDLGSAFSACDEHLLSHGGHAMAAGLRIELDKVDAFTEAFVKTANNRLTGQDLVDKLHLDAEVAFDELTMETAEAIAQLGPFGRGNPKPRLATDWIELAEEPRCVGKGQDHLQASFRQNGVRLRSIGFGMGDKIEDLKQHRRCRVAFEPLINEFNGRRSVEMRLLDIQFPE